MVTDGGAEDDEAEAALPVYDQDGQLIEPGDLVIELRADPTAPDGVRPVAWLEPDPDDPEDT